MYAHLCVCFHLHHQTYFNGREHTFILINLIKYGSWIIIIFVAVVCFGSYIYRENVSICDFQCKRHVNNVYVC